jgi:hypothetical protein
MVDAVAATRDLGPAKQPDAIKRYMQAQRDSDALERQEEMQVEWAALESGVRAKEAIAEAARQGSGSGSKRGDTGLDKILM